LYDIADHRLLLRLWAHRAYVIDISTARAWASSLEDVAIPEEGGRMQLDEGKNLIHCLLGCFFACPPFLQYHKYYLIIQAWSPSKISQGHEIIHTNTIILKSGNT
jgi:hypothetical protein